MNRDAVLVGYNFTTILGMARLLGRSGYTVRAIRTGRPAGSFVKRIGLAPEARSRYIKRHEFLRVGDDNGILRLLTEDFPREQSGKAVLIPVDDMSAELIDGHFYDMGAPAVIHQMLLARLQYLFMECIERHEMPCIALQSPCDVRLDKDNYTMVQPDLMVVCHGFDTNAIRYEGAPDLVVEVLSPSSRMKDMVLKLHKYQRAGVREYWIVDPKNQTVTVHNFTDPNYDPQKYTFADKIPVGISDGQCSIDFSRIQEWLSRFDSRNS